MSIITKYRSVGEAIGLSLRANGYSPLPIAAGEKAVYVKGWKDYCSKIPPEKEIKDWCDRYPNCGWGLACGDFVTAIDIDANDGRIANFIAKLAFAILGYTPAVRYGRRPRRVLVYRTEGNASKTYVLKPVVEVLGTGRQFVGYGVHPGTGKQYQWINEQGLGLQEIKLQDLPPVTEDKIKSFVKVIELFRLTRNGRTSFEHLESLPSAVWQIIEAKLPKGERSHQQHLAIIKLCKAGFSPEEIFWIIHSHPNGVGLKASEKNPQWLRDDIARVYQKFQNSISPEADLTRLDGKIILKRNSAMDNAMKLLSSKFSCPDGNTLVRYNGAWYQYVDSHYVFMTDEAMNGVIWNWLASCYLEINGGTNRGAHE